MSSNTTPGIAVRDLNASDVARVVQIDGTYTGEPKADYWQAIFDDFLRCAGRHLTFGLGADDGSGLTGYLFGEVRAVEFGSPPCGWIFAVGVDPSQARSGIASALLEAAVARFRAAGVSKLRTMVQRQDVPVLSFFRAGGFVGGPFVQLELDCGGE